MTVPLPSLELAPPETRCPKCGAVVFLVDPIFCQDCFEAGLQERERLAQEALVQRDLDTAKARARAWRHARADV